MQAYTVARQALRICLIFLVLACAWIFFSEEFLRRMVPAAAAATFIFIAKSLAVTIVSVLVFFLLFQDSRIKLVVGKYFNSPKLAVIRKYGPLLLFVWLGLTIAIGEGLFFHVLKTSIRLDGQSPAAIVDINHVETIFVIGTILLVGIYGYSIWLWYLRREEQLRFRYRQAAMERQTLEASYDALSKYANDIILLVDAQGTIVRANDRAVQAYGYASKDLVGLPIRDLEEIGSPLLDGDAASGSARLYEATHRRKDGSTFPVEVSARLIDQDTQLFKHMVLRDITERKQAEESLHVASLVYQHSLEAMMVTDTEGIIVSVNPAFSELTGYSMEEAVGKSANMLKSGRQNKAFYEAFWNTIKTDGHWEGEVWNKRKNGEVFPEWLRINCIRNADGEIYRYVGLFSDITQKKATEALVWHQANFDQLTGLPNRRMFYDRLDQEMKKSSRSGRPMALMFLDLDRFKEVNDSMGHDAGDQLLKEAAQRLRSCVRNSDTVARLGGDEFTVIMGELDELGSVERVARDILAKLVDPFQLGLETAYVSASIGITLFPADASDMQVLLRNADQAMYEAKHQGRNRFNYFTASMQEAAQARLQLAIDMRTALNDGQFRVHYQPIVELGSGKISKAEALVRWQHPKHGLLTPEDFVPLSEEVGLIIEIGDWVFQESARQVARWRQLFDEDFRIGINKSGIQFYDENRKSHADWFAYLQQQHISATGITVEITEDLLLDANPLMQEKIAGLRAGGMQVALDDFGKGYSSLAYFRKPAIDYLKIDATLVHGLAMGTSDMALCESIITMAHKLGIKVIAEGVETVEQRALLLASKCDYAQGFLFSAPVSADEFEAKLKH